MEAKALNSQIALASGPDRAQVVTWITSQPKLQASKLGHVGISCDHAGLSALMFKRWPVMLANGLIT